MRIRGRRRAKHKDIMFEAFVIVQVEQLETLKLITIERQQNSIIDSLSVRMPVTGKRQPVNRPLWKSVRAISVAGMNV